VADATQPAARPNTSQAAPHQKWQFLPRLWLVRGCAQDGRHWPARSIGLDLPFLILKGLIRSWARKRSTTVFMILGDLMFVNLGISKGIDIRNRDFLDASSIQRHLGYTVGRIPS
jgi:hypothetical protein